MKKYIEIQWYLFQRSASSHFASLECLRGLDFERDSVLSITINCGAENCAFLSAISLTSGTQSLLYKTAVSQMPFHRNRDVIVCRLALSAPCSSYLILMCIMSSRRAVTNPPQRKILLLIACA